MNSFDVKIKNQNIVTAPHSSSYDKNKKILPVPVDLGTDIIAKQISQKLNFSYILPKYSRFVIDLNRQKQNALNVIINGYNSIKAVNKEDIQKRYEIYEKYYQELKSLITKKSLHVALHSMLPIGPKHSVDAGTKRPDFRLGTINDKTMDPKSTKLFAKSLIDKGYDVEINNIFIGREELRFTNKCGATSIQIEINTSLISNLKNHKIVKEKLNKTSKDIISAIKLLL